MSNHYRKLRLEQMEGRYMMAGDLSAHVTKGSLFLNEAAGQVGLDNSVLISQIAPGTIRVTGNGTLADNTRSLINGAAFQDFNVSGSLNVNFGGGSDLVVFDASNPSFQNVNLNLAEPPLVLQAKSAKTTTVAPTGLTLPDKDDVMIWGATIRGSLTINTGADNDWVYVANATIGDGLGLDNVTINSGSGADSVELKNVPNWINGSIDIQTYSSLSETDADVAWLENVYANGNIGVRTGGGNDLIHFDHVDTYHEMNLDAGTGDDTVELNYALAIDKFMANLGDGNDVLTINDLFVPATGQTKFFGGNGVDRLTKTGVFPTSNVEQTDWEYINGVPTWWDILTPALEMSV